MISSSIRRLKVREGKRRNSVGLVNQRSQPRAISMFDGNSQKYFNEGQILKFIVRNQDKASIRPTGNKMLMTEGSFHQIEDNMSKSKGQEVVKVNSLKGIGRRISILKEKTTRSL